MVPIAPVFLAVILIVMWSKETLCQETSKAPATEKKASGKKLVLYLEEEDKSAK